MEQAYERYYARQLNSSRLVAYGTMLENWCAGSCCRPRAAICCTAS